MYCKDYNLPYKMLYRIKTFIKKYLIHGDNFYIPDYIRTMRILFFAEIYSKIEEMDGSIVECGVGHGNSLTMFTRLRRNEGISRRVFGFDTFSGFPYSDESVLNKKKLFEFKDVSIRKTRERVGPNAELIEGTFEKTLPNFKEEIALLFIDADLYQSHKTVLDNLYEKVVSGGIIAFDDYGLNEWPGATRAVNEFCVDKNLTLLQSKYSRRHYYVTKP